MTITNTSLSASRFLHDDITSKLQSVNNSLALIDEWSIKLQNSGLENAFPLSRLSLFSRPSSAPLLQLSLIAAPALFPLPSIDRDFFKISCHVLAVMSTWMLSATFQVVLMALYGVVSFSGSQTAH